jgi:hypothetical protein
VAKTQVKVNPNAGDWRFEYGVVSVRERIWNRSVVVAAVKDVNWLIM